MTDDNSCAYAPDYDRLREAVAAMRVAQTHARRLPSDSADAAARKAEKVVDELLLERKRELF